MSISSGSFLLETLNSTGNDTNSTVLEEKPSTVEYIVFNFVFIVFLLIPVLLLNAVIIVVLYRDTTTAKYLRLSLVNILLACTMVAAGLLLYHSSGLYLAFGLAPPPSLALCKIIIGLIAAGGALRLLFMMGFSTTVYLLVREVEFSRMFAVSIVGSCVLWFLGICGGVPFMFDDVITVTFAQGISCGPIPNGPVTLAAISLYAILFGVLCTVVTIVVMVLTACYICKKTLRDSEVLKGLVKLGFFLLAGNFIAFVGQTVPPILSVVGVSEEDVRTQTYVILFEAIYVAYTLINVSLIPPIVLMMIYFNPLRRAIKSAMCKVCKNTQFGKHSSESLQEQMSDQTKDFESPM